MTVDASTVRRELSVQPMALGLSDTEFDTLLSDLITRETERIETVLGVSLSEDEISVTTERPRHVSERHLPLAWTPIRSVSSISIDTSRAYGDDVTAADVIVTDTHLELNADAPRVSWPSTEGSITVTYTHGYPEADLPGVVEGAIIGLVRQAVQEIEADGINTESVTGDSVTYQLPETVVNRHLSRADEYIAPAYGSGGIQVI